MDTKRERWADQSFAIYTSKKDGWTAEKLIAWYQAERELSAELQQFPALVDLTTDGISRTIEHLARGARKIRTGLEHDQELPQLRVAA